MATTIFADIFTLVNDGILATLTNKSTAIIGLITPVIGICFTIYLMLIAANAMRGNVGGENVMDFFLRCIGWVTVITFGLNIEYYNHVAAFFNGLGADLSGALANSNDTNSGAMFDLLAENYRTSAELIVKEAPSIAPKVGAFFVAVILIISGAVLLSIAAAYILLAQIALGILLVIGPIFIALALFPATRKFFDAWIGQCVNYVLLTVLFNYLGTIQVNYVKQLFVNNTNYFVILITTLVGAVVFILVSFNLPSLASALAGGVGISSMVGKPIQAMKGIAGLFKGGGRSPPPPPGGGELGKG
ncbi:MAG: type IV secretion system protein [Betaproteobacteria bacterium]|nr:type IV secretion system protein [Betaproteobacteria bacterium]